MADYIPSNDNDFLGWFNNFQLKLAVYSAVLSLTPAEITSVQTDFSTIQFAVGGVEIFRTEMQERVVFKDILRDGPLGSVIPALPSVPSIAPPATLGLPGIEPRIRQLVRRIKASPVYTNAMGEDLGIIRPATTPPATPSPVFTATAQTDGVLLKFTKKGFTGVQIESKRGGETVWTLLGVKTRSPFLDTRPLLIAGVPEVRQYRLHFIKNDALVGSYSSIVSVTMT